MKRLIGTALLGLGMGMNVQASPLLMPGCAWTLLHPEQGASTGSWGWADLDKRQYIDEHTRFNLASLSKQFTALAVLMLVQDGKLALDEPLARYWPDCRANWANPQFCKSCAIPVVFQITSSPCTRGVVKRPL